MEANELRIGNYFDHNGEVDTVNPNTIAELFDADRSWINPIPLTEEWMVKFGFEKHKGTISYDKDKLSIYLGETILSEKLGRTYFNSWAILEYSPKYVHQLQNLYFALTGEELTINQ